jgi:hypothetical protein
MPGCDRTFRSCAALAATLLVASCGGETGPPFVDTITEEGLRADLYALSADSMAGRLVGSPELAKASDWIAARFASLGLEPMGDDGSYDQRFDLIWFDLAGGDRLSVAGGRARPAGDGWTPSNAGAAGEASGQVVFAGFGIVEPRLGWDDYQGADVSGRVVLVLDREPGVADPGSPFDGVVTSEASRTWRKALSAQERGASGILFVRDVQNRDEPDDWGAYHTALWPESPRRVERFSLGVWAERVTIPAAEISVALAEQLLAAAGSTLPEMAAAAEASENGLGVSAPGGVTVTFRTSVRRNVTAGRNLLGLVRGSDPALADEVVIIGAHHDHNGADGAAIYNGADDDGSGTVGVMAVAGAFARAAEAGERPRRSVLFAIWDAEERGLLGAWHYTERPVIPLEQTVANLNLDMIGRHEEVPEDGGGRFRGLEVQTAESNSNAVNILGYSRTPELARAVAAANEELAAEGAIERPLTLRSRYDNNASNLLRRSDHWPFLQSGVPGVWFHTGLHPDYHTPLDDADRIEYEKMTRIVRLVYGTARDLADADGRPALEPMGVHPPS